MSTIAHVDHPEPRRQRSCVAANAAGRKALKAVAAGCSLLVAGLLIAAAPLSLARPSETEAMLPFPMQQRTIANPAEVAWNAAAGNACGLGYCLAPELDVYYHVPARPKAVAYVFHGGSGSAQMWITGEEEAALIGDLVQANYAVVLLESTHRPVDRNWFFPDPERFDPATFRHPETPRLHDPSPWNETVNADEQLVRNVHALLGFDTSTPVFLVGFSSGAKFASAMSYSLRLASPLLNDYGYLSPRTNTVGGLNVRAAAVYNNVGVPYYFGNLNARGQAQAVALPYQYDTPTIFNYGRNDPQNDPLEVAANADFLGTLPTPVPFEKNMQEPTALQPDRFARVLGLSYAESRALYTALVADSAYVDASGFVQPAADHAPPLLRLPDRKRVGVQDQLLVLRAEHHVSSQYHNRTLAFFDLYVR